MDSKQKLKQKLQKKILKKKLPTKAQSTESPSEIQNEVTVKPKKEKPAKNAPTTNNNTSTKTKPSNEIDDIFANVKKKAGTEQKEEPKKRIRPQTDDDDGFFDSRGTSTSKRKNVDGLKMYTEDELGLTKNLTGGGTPLCPFDCECCF